MFAHSNDFVQQLPDVEHVLRNQLPISFRPMMEQAIVIYRSMAQDIKTTGYSSIYTFAILFTNIIVDVIFGIIGGFVGMNYLNKRAKLKE